MGAENCIRPEALRAAMKYDPETGIFTSMGGSRQGTKGSIVGCRRPDGYLVASFMGIRNLHLHRLAFVWMEGWCPLAVDHINRDPSDNRWSNLRPATQSLNMSNRATPPNKTGIPGVYRVKDSPKFFSRIQVQGRRIQLGTFDTSEEAAAAYQAARENHFGEDAWRRVKETAHVGADMLALVSSIEPLAEEWRQQPVFDDDVYRKRLAVVEALEKLKGRLK